MDGKALRGSKGAFTLNAYDGEEEVTLAHQLVETQTNELGALPALIDQLQLEGTICSADALYAQQAVVESLISQGADYVIAVKKNQPSLYEAIERRFGGNFGSTTHLTLTEKNRGWVEQRHLSVSSCLDRIASPFQWSGIQTVIRLRKERHRGEEYQTRYFISSLPADAAYLHKLIRGHWEIENGLHRMLDVHFKEDSCRVHERHAAANLSVLRKLAGAVLRRLDPDRTLKSKMKAMMGSPDFRLRFLRCDWLENQETFE